MIIIVVIASLKLPILTFRHQTHMRINNLQINGNILEVFFRMNYSRNKIIHSKNTFLFRFFPVQHQILR